MVANDPKQIEEKRSDTDNCDWTGSAANTLNLNRCRTAGTITAKAR